MKLSKSNFSKRECGLVKKNEFDIDGNVYTYESRDNVYDIAIIAGMKIYQKNMKGYALYPDNGHCIYREIEKHYDI